MTSFKPGICNNKCAGTTSWDSDQIYVVYSNTKQKESTPDSNIFKILTAIFFGVYENQSLLKFVNKFTKLNLENSCKILEHAHLIKLRKKNWKHESFIKFTNSFETEAFFKLLIFYWKDKRFSNLMKYRNIFWNSRIN